MILITFSLLRCTLTQYKHAEHEAIFSKRETFSNSIPVHDKTETTESRHMHIISVISFDT